MTVFAVFGTLSSMLYLLMVGVGLATAGTPSRLSSFTTHTLPAHTDRVRLIFVGDTGADAVVEGADSSHIPMAQMDALKQQVRSEQADAIFGLGDLVYRGSDPLERSPRCRDPSQRNIEELLSLYLGSYYVDLGAPAWLVLGNHDVGHIIYGRRRARCMMAYADQNDHLHLPSSQYSVDIGAARVIATDTNRNPSRWDPDHVTGAYRQDGGWNIVVGHHVLRTVFDKENEQKSGGRYDIRGWLLTQETVPDLWLNGHAHLLQFGVYDGIPAATSGSGSKLRMRPDCPGPDCQMEDAPLFSRSVHGYAVVDVTEDQLVLQFKSADGEHLFCWRRTHDDATGEMCEPGSDPLAVTTTPTPLQSQPPCEVSTAMALPDGHLLVGDNETASTLFRTRVDATGHLTDMTEIPLQQTDGDARKIKDIEAMAAWQDGVLVVGSHSRRRWDPQAQQCRADHRRRRIGLYAYDGNTLTEQWRFTAQDEEWGQIVDSAEACVTHLFADSTLSDAAVLCDAIVAAEHGTTEAACSDGLNIEGAAVVAQRIWLGLRGPVLPDRGAPLLRLSAQPEQATHLSLDAVAWLSLPQSHQGWGIRALHVYGDSLLGIAGPVWDDPQQPFVLFSTPLHALLPGATLPAQLLADLPPSSEGLAVVGSSLWVFTDGAQGDDDSACAQPSQYLSLPLESLLP